MAHVQTGPEVQISINGAHVVIHRGSQAVAAIKAAGAVAAADELDQLVDGQLVVLADDARVTIHGGESFASQPRRGGSS